MNIRGIPEGMTLEEAAQDFDIIRNMSPGEMAMLAFELTDKARQVLINDIRKQHPEFTRRQVMGEVIRKRYGEELYREIAAAKGWKENI